MYLKRRKELKWGDYVLKNMQNDENWPKGFPFQ